ncbi:hypothetical protein ANCCAN_22077 [Ancylostoma caninum]|uniref:Uncharacterized protein n=1 Tax=Ancylostoma caninum TaxID=29170 RepID=A0A368FIX8_ANCCA|nr:hypothetical protein ANCCAN_22077 [Ancylostoma caninum]
MCKAHANKDVGRECKSWSASDIKRYSKSDIAVYEIDDEFTSTSEEELEDLSRLDYGGSSDCGLNDSREYAE